MGNLKPVLLSSRGSLFQYEAAAGVWVGVPFFTDFSTSGGDVSTTETQFVDAEPAQTAGSPSPISMTVTLGSLAPGHRAVQEIDAYARAGTKVSCRFLSPKESIISNPNGAALDITGSVKTPATTDLGFSLTVAGLIVWVDGSTGAGQKTPANALNLGDLGRGHAVKVFNRTGNSAAYYPMERFGTDLTLEGALDSIYARTAAGAAPAAVADTDDWAIVLPRFIRGPFLASFGGIGNFSGGPGAQIASSLSIIPESNPARWRPVVSSATADDSGSLVLA